MKEKLVERITLLQKSLNEQQQVAIAAQVELQRLEGQYRELAYVLSLYDEESKQDNSVSEGQAA